MLCILKFQPYNYNVLRLKLFVKSLESIVILFAFPIYFDVLASKILQRIMILDGGDTSQLSMGRTFFAEWMAGVFDWIGAAPPDVDKSKLQAGKQKVKFSLPELQFKYK